MIGYWLEVFLLFLTISYFKVAVADTPADCRYEDVLGRWSFDISNECGGRPVDQFIFEMQYPNVVKVIKGYGTVGTWTLIYNQGFELTVANRKWLVMFYYDSEKNYYCDRGLIGQTRDTLLRQWRWFVPTKISPKKHSNKLPQQKSTESANLNQLYQTDEAWIKRINSAQNSWKAVRYPEFEKMTLNEITRIEGGVHTRVPSPNKINVNFKTPQPKVQNLNLPEEFDWRNPGPGKQSPVTPVRNQLKCGSCYAFASAAALESRIRIVSNFAQTPILSPQSIVDCSKYSEGCSGGFPYLIGGKYSEEFGFPIEECAPYTGSNSSKCSVRPNCPRFYTTNYRYVGGYYGACSEMEMKRELVENGPFPVGFRVYKEFKQYKSGVYKHVEVENQSNIKFDPFELVTHAVLLVGYGTDKTTNEPYWTIKNSWGDSWGEDGFFRMLRGSDECGIESLGMAFDPVL